MKIISNINKEDFDKWSQRPELESTDLSSLIEDVFAQVQSKGVEALRSFISAWDGVELDSVYANREQLSIWAKDVPVDLKNAIDRAYDNILNFHSAQLLKSQRIQVESGVKCWQESRGIERVGLYIPGGSAPLFSTVLMLGVPAQLANCNYKVLATPPQKDGKIHPAMAYAALKVGVDEVLLAGGAQAIAALTFGVSGRPGVYKLFGPGNQFVTAAKLFAQGFKVAIDMPAGPSELMIIVDDDARLEFVAADVLSQCEHGADSQVVVLTQNANQAELLVVEVNRQCALLPRKDIAQKALNNSFIAIISQEDQMDFANAYAPEHLIINSKDYQNLIAQIKNAGSVFLGPYTPESVGDYASGTNHTLPTNAYARMYSGLNMDAFVKKITFQELSKEGIMNLGPTVEVMAEAEGLQAHKKAVSVRLNFLKDE